MTNAEVLAHVFECAIQDRMALADAMIDADGGNKSARDDVQRFRALRDRMLPKGSRPMTFREWLKIAPGKLMGLDELREVGIIHTKAVGSGKPPPTPPHDQS